MVAMAFAPQIQTDCDAPVVDFDENYHLLGMEKRNALRIVTRVIKSDELV